MSKTVISVENISKCYQLGVINTGTFRGDLNRWWARRRGLPDPTLKIGLTSHDNRYGETLWALKDISFTVQQGEALGIIGRNGAGKSTLLKVLSRVTAPTTGLLKIKGRIASLLEVGTGFHPELTGRENIFLNGSILGMNKSETKRKLDEIVDFSGVEQFIDTPVKRYSSGMYVRLAFAVAAHLEPEILIIDEVLAVGDAEFQKKCLGKMSDVAHEGRTVLFVSHNMSAVRNLCTTGILLKQGIIDFIGTAEDTINKYSNSAIENQNTQNIQSRIDREGDHSVLTTGIQFKNRYNKECIPNTGELVDVIVEYKAKNNCDISKLFISITFADFFGTNLFTCTTAMKNKDFHKVSPHGYAICRIDYLPLIAGRYSINVKILNGNTLADYILHVIDFEVVDNGNSGFLSFPSNSWGNMIVQHEWRIENHG